VRVGETTVGVWRWPDDPRLPGIRKAVDRDHMRGLLAELGLPAGEIELKYRAYWPGRRAVIQATIPSSGLSYNPGLGKRTRPAPQKLLYLKVVQPRRAESLHRLHDRLARDLPTPRCVSWSKEDGLLVLEALPGTTISRCLAGGETPPEPSELLDLLGRLGGHGVPGERRRTTADKIRTHVRLLKTLLPEQSDALDGFVELYGDQREQPVTTVHGDFHEEQVLAEGGRVSGLLDIDDVGPGQLVDDLALMVGRVRARAHSDKPGHEAADTYERRLLDAFGEATDPDELRRRAAGALLGRATAPFRAQASGWPARSRERIGFATASLERWGRERGQA
jgi:aminoglycoside phosphotransferase